jgi:malate dehydrogenase (oxaloacetate-decarboxylating)(NADP+)
MSTSFDKSRRISREDALEYHSMGRKGKIEVVPTKPVATSRDLSLAYSPGVAEPCLEIEKDPELAYQYTAKGNLVAVISNGTAVLGLGDIGAVAGKPVMEGKGVLFKKFADIDVFDIEVETKDVDTFCTVVRNLEPTFGGVNLEDIKSPECFTIERRLKKEMNIPVFHDDQHGTAIISAAALLNASELVGKKLEDMKVVFIGAGAAAIACADMYLLVGLPRKNVWMCDRKGLIYKGRPDNNEWKDAYAQGTTPISNADVVKGADAIVGLSVKGMITKEMVASMAKDPIVFALANPNPEITPEEVLEVRQDAITATGRSDYANQVNNVLGFPGIFRGALDVRARQINDEMKLAASRALAALARQDVPESVSAAYGGKRFRFGRDYIIPKPFDPRVLITVAPAVAEAAMQTGVARIQVERTAYIEQLRRRQGRTYEVMTVVLERARQKNTRIAFAEGNHPRILRAAAQLLEDKICTPVLLGKEEEIRSLAKESGLSAIDEIEIIEPVKSPKLAGYIKEFFQLRQRSGVSLAEAEYRMRQRNTFGSMLLNDGTVDGLVTGLTRNYPEAIRPALEIIKTQKGKKASGTYILAFKQGIKLLADCTVNTDPSSEDLAETAIATAELAKAFDLVPRIAALSYSNFGSGRGGTAARIRRAVEIVRERRPDLEIDGEMQVDPAVSTDVRNQDFPFSRLTGDANVLIFPNLEAGNIGYKLLWRLGGAEVIGPVLMGMAKPVNILQQGASVQDVFNLAAMTAVRAQGGLNY